MAFLPRGYTPRVKPGWLRACHEADPLTHSLSLSPGQVNNATARVMTNKKPGNPYANGENPRLPACFRDWNRSLGKLRQPKASLPVSSCFHGPHLMSQASHFCPVRKERSAEADSWSHRPHPHSWCLQSEPLSFSKCPQLPEAI